MIEEFQEEQRRKVARVRGLMDYVMGSILFLLGVFFLIYGQLGFKIMKYEHSGIDYLIGAMFVLYGIWRIYRGYKKEYFR